MSNRRDFLKLLGLGAIAPVIPKIPLEPTKSVAPTLLAGKIKIGGLIANIENNSDTIGFGVDGPERFRIYANQSMSKMYEEAIWFGNPVKNKNK